METASRTRDDLWAAVEAFDAEAAELALAGLLAGLPLSGAVAGVVLPFLQDVGDRWEAGTLSVAHEHFVSELLRRRLLALSTLPARPFGGADGSGGPGGSDGEESPDAPVVLLACPPGERHDMVLLCTALMLRERGVRTRFLGADTPVPAILTAARGTRADAVVLAGTRPTTFTAHASALRRLAADHPVYVAGRGADASTAAEVGARLLPGDAVRAVVALVGELQASGSW